MQSQERIVPRSPLRRGHLVVPEILPHPSVHGKTLITRRKNRETWLDITTLWMIMALIPNLWNKGENPMWRMSHLTTVLHPAQWHHCLHCVHHQVLIALVHHLLDQPPYQPPETGGVEPPHLLINLRSHMWPADPQGHSSPCITDIDHVQ